MVMDVFDRHESNVRSYCRSFPCVFERARGAEMFDVAGARYIDFFAGAGALNYGHNHGDLKRAILAHIECDGVAHALDMHTAAKARFLETFTARILSPRRLDYKMQFCGPTGADAIEAALKIARRATGRPGVIAFTGGYHGMTQGSLAVTTSRYHRSAAGTALGSVTFVPYPAGPGGVFDTVSYLEMLFDDDHSGMDPPAAVILETVQMEGGVYIASTEFLRKLRELCDRHRVLLICDDIQAGCGRTGPFFSFERAGITPDITVLSKALSGYGFPMSMVLMHPALDVLRPGEHVGTFRGHQLSFVSGAAALELFWRRGDAERLVEERERVLRGALERLAARLEGVEVRGIGMAFGIDLRRRGGGSAAGAASRSAFERGLIVERCGRGGAVVKVIPPLNIEVQLLERGCEILTEAVTAACARKGACT